MAWFQHINYNIFGDDVSVILFHSLRSIEYKSEWLIKVLTDINFIIHISQNQTASFSRISIQYKSFVTTMASVARYFTNHYTISLAVP